MTPNDTHVISAPQTKRDAHPRTPKRSRNLERAAFLALAVLLLWPYGVALRTHAVGYVNDDAVYVVTAKSLAEGHGYNITSLPQVVRQTKYPILFPLFLAGLWKLDPQFPQNVWLLRLAPFLWALAWFALAFLLLREEAKSSRQARWLVLLSAAMPATLFLSTTVIAGTMFTALATGSLWLLLRCESAEGDQPLWTAAGAGLIGGAAFLARTVALPLLAAGVASLVARRKYRSVATYAALWLATALPWVVWQRVEFRRPPLEEAYYSMANYQAWNLIGNFTLQQKATIIWKT